MYSAVIYRRNKGKKRALLLFSLAFTLLLVFIATYYKPQSFFTTPSTDFTPLIKAAAKRHNIDPDLLKALIWKESKFNPNAKGTKGEVGLMQIRPEKGAVTEWEKAHNRTISCKGVLFRPELNIEIGSWYLSKALENWKDYKYQYELALSQYNAGKRGMKSWTPKTYDENITERITIPSTKAYVKAIMKKYQEYALRRKAE